MTEPADDHRGDSSSSGLPGWQKISSFLVWLGGSTGTISVVLTVFGFLVEHARFDRLGVPRTLYEATSREYVVTGGKLLMGLLPMALAGFLQFCVNDWWLAAGILVAGAVTVWKSKSSNVRWLVAAACLIVALAVVGARFLRHDGSDGPGVAMFTFVVVGALVFCYIEIAFGRPDTDLPHLASKYAFRLPFLVFLICSVVTLPYIHGFYSPPQDYPVAQFLGKDKTYFCELAGVQNSPQRASCDLETWQIIEIGKDRAILRRISDSKIYVVPAGSLTAFRIFGKEPTQ
jgi:lysylphosphatidylglycerol synthetase-like protein (DUF2156 family)